MGSTRNVDMSAEPTAVKIVETSVELEGATTEGAQGSDAVAVTAETSTADATTPATKTVVRHGRSKKYQMVRSNVDKTKMYDPFAAIELVKRLSYSSFPGTISAHGVVREAGATVDVSFPHSTGKKRTVAIFGDEVLKEIEAGEIKFDVLLARPDQMKDLTKFARVLGPRGLMPNPKTGTLTPDPEKKAKELESGNVTIKAEKKAPLIHVVIGKTDMDTKEMVENLQALMKAFKGRLVKLTLAATMSPSVKVEIEE